MIAGQLLYVTAAFVSGIAIMFAYDVLLILREVVKLNLAFIILEDILFWISAAFAEFYVIYRFNEGRIRLYAMLSLFLGMIVLQCLIGRRMVKKVTFFIKLLKKYLKNLIEHCRMKLSKHRD